MAIKVKNLRAHVGAQIGAQVFTSIDSAKEKMEMFMGDQGVFVRVKAETYFIPYGTIASLKLDNETLPEGMKEKKEKAKA